MDAYRTIKRVWVQRPGKTVACFQKLCKSQESQEFTANDRSKTTMHWGSLLTGEDEVSTSGATITGSCWSQKLYLQNTKWDRCCGKPVAWSILTWRKRKTVFNSESSKKYFESETQALVLTVSLTVGLRWPNLIQPGLYFCICEMSYLVRGWHKVSVTLTIYKWTF